MKKLLSYFFLSVTLFSFSQQKLWKGYFSYNEITDVCISPSKVHSSTKNSVFNKDVSTNILTTFTSVNDVKPDEITAVFQTSNKYTLVGNKNGLIIIIKPDGTTLNKVDIISEVQVSANSKRINDFYEFNGKVYVSTQYGITVIKLSNFEIEVSFYIGNTGENIDVLQTTILNGEIYAVTRNQGIKKATLSNPFLYNFSQWSVFNSSNWLSIVTFNNQLAAMNTDGYTYRFLGNTPQQFSNQVASGLKLRTDNTYLTISNQWQILVYNQSFALVSIVYQIPNFPDSFTCAITKNDKLYIGTKKSGLFETTVVNPTVFTNISPNGPIEDYAFKVTKTSNDLWLTHGAYDRTYDPNYKFQGISIFNKNNGWGKIPTTELQGAVSLAAVAQNPRNLNEVFVASGHSGMLKFTNKANAFLYNQTNFLESVGWAPGYISVRINGMKYDKDGNLWLTNALVNKGIKVLKSNNTWQSFDLSTIVQSPEYVQYGNIDIDKNSTKWVATYGRGVIAFNEKYNNKYIVINQEESNLPSNDVRCVAVDNRNQLWIGTFTGLRILNSVDRFISESELTTTNIVIQEGDLAQELFYQQVIQDIKVDGSNNKWVSIADAGVFQVSPNGQTTLRRFTKDNSPLPSNNVLDIEIDEVSGEVFFATDKGLVSFLGTSTKGDDDLQNVYAYPNPVRPGYSGTVKISGLMDKVNLKITDIEGNLVFETTSSGGTVEWDTTAFGKYKVASGVYMVFVTSSDAAETTVKKIMVIR
ncbi:type IX secretion system anionic LPS delivery protein PorZ [Flavobacterium terrigena]|uniref:Two component regulator propeller n=1 Tax=Flavobacterium terrigena TaxID=402734 RepID=A0A1H6TB24_9FLAO|nr:two-component regulator propeller domain-containing protein [Flavobacterium terrigena]SEI77259.1 Two component regulator propeller [Flavobacterium terrigena]